MKFQSLDLGTCALKLHILTPFLDALSFLFKRHLFVGTSCFSHLEPVLSIVASLESIRIPGDLLKRSCT